MFSVVAFLLITSYSELEPVTDGQAKYCCLKRWSILMQTELVFCWRSYRKSNLSQWIPSCFSLNYIWVNHNTHQLRCNGWGIQMPLWSSAFLKWKCKIPHAFLSLCFVSKSIPTVAPGSACFPVALCFPLRFLDVLRESSNPIITQNSIHWQCYQLSLSNGEGNPW